MIDNGSKRIISVSSEFELLHYFGLRANKAPYRERNTYWEAHGASRFGCQDDYAFCFVIILHLLQVFFGAFPRCF